MSDGETTASSIVNETNEVTEEIQDMVAQHIQIKSTLDMKQMLDRIEEVDIEAKLNEVSEIERRYQALTKENEELDKEIEKSKAYLRERFNQFKEIREQLELTVDDQTIHRLIYKINTSRTLANVLLSGIKPTDEEDADALLDIAQKLAVPRSVEHYEKMVDTKEEENETPD